MPVQQSGDVTPGHLAIWTTTGVLEDGGAPPVTADRVLASFLNANFADTTDQPILLPEGITDFQLTGIIITGATASLAASVGGFYPEADKAGTPIVEDTQEYDSLTNSNLLLNATLSADALVTRFSRANLPDWAIYFSLTSAEVTPALANIYLIGINLTP